MTERLQREKQYHNTAFSEGVRKSADKYYAVHKISFEELSALLEKYGKGKKVLEYGCGPGSHSFILARYADTVTSVDISDYAINNASKLALEKGLNNLSFIEMDAENLQFEAQSFDLVYGNAILHHLNLEKAFCEIDRVLKKGGKAFFYEPLGHNFFINIYRKLTPRMRTVDEHPLTMKDITFVKTFFKIADVRYYHLTTILAVPFRNLRGYHTLLRFLHKTDRFLFGLLPFIQKYAWYCVIEISKPAGE